MIVETKRDKLIGLIQEAVPGVARYWAGLIANHLIENGVEIPVKCSKCKYQKTCSILFEDPNSKEYGFCSLGERQHEQERDKA